MNASGRFLLRASHSCKSPRGRLALSTVGNDNRPGRLSTLASDGFDLLDDIHTVAYVSEDAMLPIQPSGLDGAQKELGSVGVRSSVSHGQDARSGVRELKVLISELGSVDGLSSSSVSSGGVSSLTHKLRDHTVKGRSLEVKRLSRLSHTLLASAEASEVLGRLRDDICSQLHGNPAGVLAADGHVEENLWVGHLGEVVGERSSEELR